MTDAIQEPHRIGSRGGGGRFAGYCLLFVLGIGATAAVLWFAGLIEDR